MEKVGKALAYWLRHRPEDIGIMLDEEGWTDLSILASKSGFGVDAIKEAVRTCPKQRYTIKDGRIRANQGHSVALQMTFTEVIPPTHLYHGTVERFLEAIKQQGLKPMSRHHVHLSADAVTALQVGNRRGRAKILTIDAKRMYGDGHKFFISDNGVYLVDAVAPEYITAID